MALCLHLKCHYLKKKAKMQIQTRSLLNPMEMSRATQLCIQSKSSILSGWIKMWNVLNPAITSVLSQEIDAWKR